MSNDEYQQQNYWKKPVTFMKKSEWDWMNFCMGNWEHLSEEQIKNFKEKYKIETTAK